MDTWEKMFLALDAPIPTEKLTLRIFSDPDLTEPTIAIKNKIELLIGPRKSLFYYLEEYLIVVIL